MHYYLIFALQIYCMYHAIKNRNEYYWLFIIFFIPVLGSLIYLVTQVFNKRELKKVQSELVAIINPTKKVLELKNKLDFSETFSNKVNLADAYFEIRDYKSAIHYYENAIDSVFSTDTYAISKLTEAYYHMEDYDNVIKNYQNLEGKRERIKPEIQLYYGISLDKSGKVALAEKAFQKIDTGFSNYNERLLLAQHLIHQNKEIAAKEMLQKVYDESKHFSKKNHQMHKYTIQNVKSLLKTI